MSQSLILSLLDPNDVIFQIYPELIDHVLLPLSKCDAFYSHSFTYL